MAYISKKSLIFYGLLSLSYKFTNFQQSIEKVICDIFSHVTFPWRSILNKMNEKQRPVFTGNILIYEVNISHSLTPGQSNY